MSSAKETKVTYVTLFADESIHPKYEAAIKRLSKSLGKHYAMEIDGEFVESKEGEFAVRSPIDTSIVVGHFPLGTRKHARAAVSAASKAFRSWGRTPWKERVRVLHRATGLMDERKFDIAASISYEVGKNRTEAIAEVWESIDAIKTFIKSMESNDGYVRTMGPGGPGEKCTMVMKPYGVWPVISPFNFPFMLANGMASGALITGNTVVLKPTSAAALTGLSLFRIYRDAGVPAGAVNFVTGPGANYEKEFTHNPKVAGIAFTGSRDVGMRLFSEFEGSQQWVKPVVMELGSKNPAIITSKADLNKAVEGVTHAAYGYSGQKCSAASRVYVQKSVKKEFLSLIKARLEKIRRDGPASQGSVHGSGDERSSGQDLRGCRTHARRRRAAYSSADSVLKKGLYSKGYYVEPTVVVDLPRGHKLFKQELFLPFLLVDEFKTLEEAIGEANDTEYGLTAGIFTEDEKEVRMFMDEIQFGVVYANRKGGATTGAWPGAQSFVGWKASGTTGKGVGGPNYLLTFLREQSQTIVSG